jgi:hypothetical protein
MEYDYDDYDYNSYVPVQKDYPEVQKMFSNADFFPWTWYFGKPMYGSAFVHICRYASLIEFNTDLRYILEHNPTSKEVKNFTAACSSAKAIIDYTESLDNLLITERKALATEVLGFLRVFPGFYVFVENEYKLRRQQDRLD